MRLATPRNGLLAGLALIALTNAVTLGLVAWNRSGEPEALLTLSERELEQPGAWQRRNSDNSSLTLTLRWGVAPPQRPIGLPSTTPIEPPDAAATDAWLYGAEATWLDDEKLGELGVPLRDEDGRRRQRSYPVLLVLEQDGPAYQQTMELARQHLAAENALRDANIGAMEFVERARRASERLDKLDRIGSRLFVVDAGLNADSLRARYPDRHRYAIVAGRIREGWHDPSRKTPRRGYIEQINAAVINVPKALRSKLPEPVMTNSARRPVREASAGLRFTAEIAFGGRLEPWLQSVQRQAVESN